MILMALNLWAILVSCLATVKVIRWATSPARKIHRRPGVSILKPIRGLEPELETNLHSFFNLEYSGPFEILLCVKNAEDPCLPIVQKLISLHPQVDARLIIGAPNLGRNPKISNMHTAWKEAHYGLILISDSNVRVAPDYIQTLLAQREEGDDLVSQVVYGTGANTLGGHLDVVHLNTFYLKATAILNYFGITCILGKCMFLSKKAFDQLGGLFEVRNYLAEDLIMGEMLKDAGYATGLAPSLLRQTTVMTNFKSYWQRHVRWARLRKCHFFLAYFLEPLLFETIWPVLLIIFSKNSLELTLGISCLGVQVLSNLILHSIVFKEREAWKSLPYFAVKDLVAPMIWFAGLISNHVFWRGQNLHLRFGGKLGTKYLRPARVRRFYQGLPVSRYFS